MLGCFLPEGDKVKWMGGPKIELGGSGGVGRHRLEGRAARHPPSRPRGRGRGRGAARHRGAEGGHRRTSKRLRRAVPGGSLQGTGGLTPRRRELMHIPEPYDAASSADASTVCAAAR